MMYCSKNLLETVTEVFRQTDLGDAPLRWSLLCVLSDADFLVRAATGPLPEARVSEGCETSRDMELFVCTMLFAWCDERAGDG